MKDDARNCPTRVKGARTDKLASPSRKEEKSPPIDRGPALARLEQRSAGGHNSKKVAGGPLAICREGAGHDPAKQ